jgi:hypothetical protein
MPLFDPGPSSIDITGAARARRIAVAPTAKKTGRRWIDRASRIQKLYSESRRSRTRFGTSRTRSSFAPRK